MAGYQIRRRFGHHKLGTKAYQIWEVQFNTKVCIVFQFGKFRTGQDPLSMGGTVNVIGVYDAFGAEAVALKQERAKTARGYGPWDVDVCPLATVGEFYEVANKAFGATKGQEVLQALEFGAVPDVSDELPTSAPENSVMGKAKPPAPKSEESLPEWGTW
jgi:hypothetical protein